MNRNEYILMILLLAGITVGFLKPDFESEYPDTMSKELRDFINKPLIYSTYASNSSVLGLR